MELVQERDHAVAFLEVLKKALTDLQNNIIFTTMNPQHFMETLSELETRDDNILSSDPKLSNVSKQLSNLKTLLQKHRKCQGYSVYAFLCRQITNYRIYQVAAVIEAEIQGYIDRENVLNLVKTLREVDTEEEMKVGVLREFEKRLSTGFDRDLQELVLKARVFSLLETLICDSTCSMRIREYGALAVVALVRFNKNVFVGLVLMGSIIQALISIASHCSLGILRSLVRLIRIPMIDKIELDGEIPRIICLLSSEDLTIKSAAMDCLCEIAYLGRKEVIEAMLEQGLIEKLMELQRSIHGDNLTATLQSCEDEEGATCEEDGPDIESEERKIMVDRPFESCVARFSVQVEVGEGLSQTEKNEYKGEILRKVRDSSVSDAESATIVAEVLWGSSP